ncbi:MAG: hypothetical protein N2171_02420 [Clostridia bacterium]|nr:hypothetical protein [Clostridia bacterium]
MKRIFLLIALFITIGLSACTEKTEPVSFPVVPSETPALIQKNIEPAATSAVSDGWTQVSTYSCDIDEDGQDEIISLYTSAGKDKKGKILWDDGQNWVLEMHDGNEYYTLFSGYVQLGNLYFEVSDYYKDSGTTPVVTLIESESANFKVINYMYDVKEKHYTQKIVFDSASDASGGINRKFSSIPVIE